ncbi:MAG: hypothetical protein Q8Q26_01655 [Pseudorhodobacter sp.]|nr:hypothetical protein [Pseudorhodobacter sp.]
MQWLSENWLVIVLIGEMAATGRAGRGWAEMSASAFDPKPQERRAIPGSN